MKKEDAISKLMLIDKLFALATLKSGRNISLCGVAKEWLDCIMVHTIGEEIMHQLYYNTGRDTHAVHITLRRSGNGGYSIVGSTLQSEVLV